jgi:hypothetical protein
MLPQEKAAADKVSEEKVASEKKEAEWMNTSTNCTTDIVLILMMQFSLVIFLLGSTIFDADNKISFDLPTDVNLVICRIICTVFLHISLSGEL